MKASGSMSANRDRAVALLQHYMSLRAAQSGAKWDNDNMVEVEEIVDSIIAAAREKQPTEHEKNVAKI